MGLRNRVRERKDGRKINSDGGNCCYASYTVRCRLCGIQNEFHRGAGSASCKRCGYPFTEKDLTLYT